MKDLFESSVNPEGIQTTMVTAKAITLFESSVNPEGIQTTTGVSDAVVAFESSVNPEGIQTPLACTVCHLGLRAV